MKEQNRVVLSEEVREAVLAQHAGIKPLNLVDGEDRHVLDRFREETVELLDAVGKMSGKEIIKSGLRMDVASEVADVYYFAINFADRFGVKLFDQGRLNLELNNTGHQGLISILTGADMIAQSVGLTVDQCLVMKLPRNGMKFAGGDEVETVEEALGWIQTKKDDWQDFGGDNEYKKNYGIWFNGHSWEELDALPLPKEMKERGVSPETYTFWYGLYLKFCVGFLNEVEMA